MVLSSVVGFLFTFTVVRADHTTTDGGLPVLWAELLPPGDLPMRYSICRYDPDFPDPHVDGDEYRPSEWLAAPPLWANSLTAYTPLSPALERDPMDLPPFDNDCVPSARFRVAVQVWDGYCGGSPACWSGSTYNAGTYRAITTATVFVSDNFWRGASEQWRSWLVLHELGHNFSLEDHTATCDPIMMRSGELRQTIMAQRSDQMALPCVSVPTRHDLLGSACTAYGYVCRDIIAHYALAFGPSPIALSSTTPKYMWLVAEMSNVYEAANVTVTTVSFAPGSPSGCVPEDWKLILPGSQTFTAPGSDSRFLVWRAPFECHSPTTPGSYPQEFLLCVRLLTERDDNPFNECAGVSRSLFITN